MGTSFTLEVDRYGSIFELKKRVSAQLQHLGGVVIPPEQMRLHDAGGGELTTETLINSPAGGAMTVHVDDGPPAAEWPRDGGAVYVYFKPLTAESVSFDVDRYGSIFELKKRVSAQLQDLRGVVIPPEQMRLVIEGRDLTAEKLFNLGKDTAMNVLKQQAPVVAATAPP